MQRTSRLPVIESAAEREARLYEEARGREARERQQADRRERHVCCGELIAEGHHFLCSNRPADETPAVIEGQDSLI